MAPRCQLKPNLAPRWQLEPNMAPRHQIEPNITPRRQLEHKMTPRRHPKLCKTRENSNFMKKDKMVISVKIRNFSRFWMAKWTSLLKSSPKIYLPRRILSNSETVRISYFSRQRGSAGHLAQFEWFKRCHVSCAELVKHELKCGTWVDTWHDAI